MSQILHSLNFDSYLRVSFWGASPLSLGEQTVSSQCCHGNNDSSARQQHHSDCQGPPIMRCKAVVNHETQAQRDGRVETHLHEGGEQDEAQLNPIPGKNFNHAIDGRCRKEFPSRPAGRLQFRQRIRQVAKAVGRRYL